MAQALHDIRLKSPGASKKALSDKNCLYFFQHLLYTPLHEKNDSVSFSHCFYTARVYPRWGSTNRFEGDIKDSEPTSGKWFYPNGDIFDGSFKNFKPRIGIYYYVNGDKFIGNLKDWAPDTGTHYYLNGTSATVKNGATEK